MSADQIEISVVMAFGALCKRTMRWAGPAIVVTGAVRLASTFLR